MKVEKADLEKPDQVIDSEAVSFHVTGQVMYVGTIDHQISQIIFQGKENTFVYDTTNIQLHDKTYLKYHENIPVPMENLDADEYEIYVMYQDQLYDTEQTVTVK